MPGGFSSGFSSGFGADAGTYRFLADHYFNGEIIRAGETRHMIGIWSPTPEVDPIDLLAVQMFYSMGPQISSQIISRWTNLIITAPITYWFEVTPNQWALTGLGADQVTYPPIRAIIGRL